MIAKCDLKYLNDRQKGLDKEKRSVVSTGDFDSKNEIDEGKRRVANMGTNDTIDKGRCEALNSFNFENTQSLADNEMKLDSLSPLESEVICDVSASVDDWSCLFSANQCHINSPAGQLQLSLSYDPWLSSLKISIIKAKGLTCAKCASKERNSGIICVGTFFKISLLCGGKLTQSKRTATKTRKAEIFFYEKFSFVVEKEPFVIAVYNARPFIK
ncbi:uncharacterized protein LOC124452958 [Xenia sp. Carnegie-2017]|uniref:uncharacterized protein LOC124452958 n=1 Tax=Xenia sp. Carnegie-2017 TaxID=2897299 RepID=UPI001F04D06A|nr:uncharacterized protein LOC124452958 [Xenia sp. Carnegie-2017]